MIRVVSKEEKLNCPQQTSSSVVWVVQTLNVKNYEYKQNENRCTKQAHNYYWVFG